MRAVRAEAGPGVVKSYINRHGRRVLPGFGTACASLVGSVTYNCVVRARYQRLFPTLNERQISAVGTFQALGRSSCGVCNGSMAGKTARRAFAGDRDSLENRRDRLPRRQVLIAARLCWSAFALPSAKRCRDLGIATPFPAAAPPACYELSRKRLPTSCVWPNRINRHFHVILI